MATAPQVTAWDAQGNPIQAQGATAWDAQGNPVTGTQETQPEGFWASLGHAFGAHPSEHPVRDAILGGVLGPLAKAPEIVEGIVGQGKRTAEELGAAGRAYTDKDTPGFVTHAAKAIPIIGQGLEAAESQASPTTGSYLGDVGKELTNPALMGTVLGTAAQGALAVEGARGGVPEAAEAEETAPAGKPGIIQQIRQGKKVAQEPAQQAIREGVQAAGDKQGAGVNVQGPILEGNRTILDPTLEKLDALTSAEYAKLDEVAGFDVKAAERQLHDIQAELNQGVATSQNLNRRGNLIETANDLTDALNEADTKLQAAGIDPTVPRRMFQQQMAGNDLKKAVIRATSPDGSVNVDQLLTASKNLRFTRWGDRLEQFFGSPQAANDYMSQLMKAQQLGVHSLKMQRLAQTITKRIAQTAGIGAGLGVVNEVRKAWQQE